MSCVSERTVSGFQADRTRALKAHANRIAAQLGIDNANGNYELPPVAPLVSATRNFVSQPNAKPMKRSDIANVQFLNIHTAREILNEVAAVAPGIAAKARQHVEEQWASLLTEAERFTLSAMAARKFLREREAATV